MKETKVQEKITMADLGNHITCPFCKEKDKRIKELEQKVQELQELDNKRAFRLYAVLYDVLEKQDSENVASRIDYLTGKDYSEMCEMYKTAKNIKQHDKELVAKIIEFINELAWKDVQYDAFQSTIGEFSGSTSAIPRYAKKYFDLWKEMFGEDLNE